MPLTYTTQLRFPRLHIARNSIASKVSEHRAPKRETIRVHAPLTEAMAERVRAVISRQPGHNLLVVSQTLAVCHDSLRQLIEQPDQLIDMNLLVDVISALVYEAGIDPMWLLTGSYDPKVHRRLLLLGENRTVDGAAAVRAFVEEQYQFAHEDALAAQ